MSSGAYCRSIFSKPRFKFAPPPKITDSSEKFEQAMSIGSLKWLIRYRRIYVEHPCEPCRNGTAFRTPLKTNDAPNGAQSLQAFFVARYALMGHSRIWPAEDSRIFGRLMPLAGKTAGIASGRKFPDRTGHAGRHLFRKIHHSGISGQRQLALMIMVAETNS